MRKGGAGGGADAVEGGGLGCYRCGRGRGAGGGAGAVKGVAPARSSKEGGARGEPVRSREVGWGAVPAWSREGQAGG